MARRPRPRRMLSTLRAPSSVGRAAKMRRSAASAPQPHAARLARSSASLADSGAMRGITRVVDQCGAGKRLRALGIQPRLQLVRRLLALRQVLLPLFQRDALRPLASKARSVFVGTAGNQLQMGCCHFDGQPGWAMARAHAARHARRCRMYEVVSGIPIVAPLGAGSLRPSARDPAPPAPAPGLRRGHKGSAAFRGWIRVDRLGDISFHRAGR